MMARSDKGSIKLQERDLAALRWLVDMRAAYESDLAVLLGRLRDDGPRRLSDSTTRALVARWERAELAVPKRLLAKRPRIVSATRGAARLAGEATTWHDPALWTAVHGVEVAHLRLWLESPGERMHDGTELHPEPDAWVSERSLRQFALGGRSAKERKGKQPHLPDAELVTDAGRWAIELERTAKNPDRLRDIVQELVTSGRYQRVVYYVPRDGAIAAHVEKAYEAAAKAQQSTLGTWASGGRVAELYVRPYPDEELEA